MISYWFVVVFSLDVFRKLELRQQFSYVVGIDVLGHRHVDVFESRQSLVVLRQQLDDVQRG